MKKGLFFLVSIFALQSAFANNIVAIVKKKEGSQHGSEYLIAGNSNVSPSLPANSPPVTEMAKLRSSLSSTGERFGENIEVHGNRFVASAVNTSNNKGAVYVFEHDGTEWSEIKNLSDSSGVSDDYYGRGIDIYGSTVVVGSSNKSTNGSDAGTVFVYTDNGGSWTEQKIVSSDNDTKDYFGMEVAIDGNIMAIGASSESTGESRAGAVYIFENQSGTWVEVQKIQSNTPGSWHHFGSEVEIYNNKIYVHEKESNDIGSVYEFTHNGTEWVQTQKIEAIDNSDYIYFGSSIDVNDDFLIIGSHGENSERGAAYVFSHDGSEWVYKEKLTSSDIESGDKFGYQVDLSGNLLLVSSPSEGSAVGAVYIFEYESDNWVEKNKITTSDGNSSDQFGIGMAIDGDTALIGAYRANGDLGSSDLGAVYVFEP